MHFSCRTRREYWTNLLDQASVELYVFLEDQTYVLSCDELPRDHHLEVLVLVGLGRRFTHLNRDDVADDTACIERRMQSLGCGAVNALMISSFSVVNASTIAVRRFSRFLGCHWLVISAKDIHWGI